ncbi:hypothetical protein RJ639_022330 [Escallonia herrerae]|uniref:RNase H type-1 domain-containing protein n=1 Tax=Escallonia herrerae TaxID=1293975 RepID=A0AA88V430_9ASTE|nr:hypothetical protein RJ639_022330 [Escallonia herrerae]
MKPPVLMALVKGKPMILYTAAMDASLGALLAQHNDQGRENALYYLSRTLVGAELRKCLVLFESNISWSRTKVYGYGKEEGIIPHSFSLIEGCSNNEAEYEAMIAGLELSLKVSIDDLTIYGDSELIRKHLKGEYQIRKPNLFPYYERADYLLSKFPKLQIRHVRRGENGRTDALASLATSLGLSENKEMTITVGARRVLQPYEKGCYRRANGRGPYNVKKAGGTRRPVRLASTIHGIFTRWEVAR